MCAPCFRSVKHKHMFAIILTRIGVYTEACKRVSFYAAITMIDLRVELCGYILSPGILNYLDGKVSRFSVGSLIKMLFFCRDRLYRLCKQYDHVIMLSKNQSAHFPCCHLISLCANSCKFINHGIKRSGQ